MLRQGPIPRFVHGILEYAVGALLVVAPFVFDFTDQGAATAVSIVLGVAVILLAATTAGTTSLVDVVPTSLHVTVDYVVAAILIASPFLFGFADEPAPTALFIALGVAHLLVTVATRFVRQTDAGRRSTSASGSSR